MSATETSGGRRGETLRLVTLLDGRVAGNVYQGTNGRLRFVYADTWRDDSASYPVSFSMPLSSWEHGDATVVAFLWGLLPDNNQALDHYGRTFGVSSSNPVALLSHMGADCAGAIQFAPPERSDALLRETNARADIEWLDEDEIATELRVVRTGGIPGAGRRTEGQFSLAGAQPKIALLEDGGRWGRPSGRTPTNRILKPPLREFRGFAENEHFCLGLSQAIGLSAVQSRVLRFGAEVAIVVDRFDRVKRGRTWYRIHQEDCCQALSVMPTRKYENEGGPGIHDVVTLVREASRQLQEDVDRFLSAVALNWIIAATDGHAKNCALLHAPNGATRLAPFYDIASDLPYADRALHRTKLAMKVGSKYLVNQIGRTSWQAMAKSIGVPALQVAERVEHVIDGVDGALDEVRARLLAERLDERVVGRLADRIRDRVSKCRKLMRRF